MCIGITAATFLYIIAFIPESAPRCLKTRRRQADAHSCAQHPAHRQHQDQTPHPPVRNTCQGSGKTEVLHSYGAEPAGCGGDGSMQVSSCAVTMDGSLPEGENRANIDDARPLLSPDVVSSSKDEAIVHVHRAAGEPAGEGDESSSHDTSPLLSPAAGSSASKDAVIFVGYVGETVDCGTCNKAPDNTSSAVSGGGRRPEQATVLKGAVDEAADADWARQQEAGGRSSTATLLAGWHVLRQSPWYRKLAVIWVIVSISVTALQVGR
jgi:hypothetical protein